MKSLVVAWPMLLAGAPALATDSLLCAGEGISLQMSVGADDIVDSALLSVEATGVSIAYRRADIENRRLTWTAAEGDFSANRLHIVLRGRDGRSSVVEARGRQGVLRQHRRRYRLDCDWTR